MTLKNKMELELCQARVKGKLDSKVTLKGVKGDPRTNCSSILVFKTYPSITRK